MIDQATIERVKDAADIEDVVRSYGVELKRRGASLWANCPFPGHEEKTPSFCVTPAKGMCKCFGCGRGGDAIGFVRIMDNSGYLDAIRTLAKKYGIELNERQMTEEERRNEDKRESLFAINEFADRWFQEQMWQTPSGQNIAWRYFNGRGIREDIARDFHLGYCPDNYNSFFKAAKQSGYSEELLEELGLCKKSERTGKYWDFYRGRVMFPIHTASGRVIAFGGRILEKRDDIGKYFNSRESDDFYVKSRELYGLFQARPAIRIKNHCYLCEGYMDVIAMHQNGLTDTVASCGTSLTAEQAKRISCDAKNITILYDGDKAGIKAAIRAIDLLLPNEMKINVLVLPDDDDPDSFARKHTTEEYVEYIENNQTNWIDYLISYAYGDKQNDINAQTEVVSDFVRRLALIPNDIYRNVCNRTVANRLNVTEDFITRQVEKARRDAYDEAIRQQYSREKAKTRNQQTTPVTPVVQQDVVQQYPLDQYAKNILQLLLRYGNETLCPNTPNAVAVSDWIIDNLNDDGIRFENPLLQQIFEEYQIGERDFTNHPNPNVRDVVAQLINDEHQISRFFAYEDNTQELEKLVIQRRRKTAESDITDISANEASAEESKTVTKLPSDADNLDELVPKVVYEYKYEVLRARIQLSFQKLEEEKNNKEIADQIIKDIYEDSKIERQLAIILEKVIL